MEASHDLGATPGQTFWKVIFPLSIPGVVAGATFAFVLSLGDFLAPLLLGGPSGIMISNIVVSLFGAAYNWPLGAAISLCMLLLVVSLLFLLGAAGKEMELLVSENEDRLEAHAGCCFMPSQFSRSSICRLQSLFFIRSTAKAWADFRRTISRSIGIACLFADGPIWDSVLNSLQVALAAMAISLIFGVPAALALERAQFPGKALFRRLVLLPLILAGHYYRTLAADVI